MNEPELKAQIKDRISEALSIRGMKPAELCQKTGIPKSSISHYMKGLVEPKQERIYLISKALNVSEAWLIGYDVPMEKNEPVAMDASELTEDQAKILELFNSLTTEDQQMALVLIMAMVAQRDGKGDK